MQSSKIYHGGGKPKTRFSSLGEGGGLDEKVKVSNIDTTPNYLVGKMTFTNLHGSVQNPGGDERLNIEDEGKGAVTLNDTTPNYLSSKLTAGAGIQNTILNPGGNEQLQINNTREKTLYTMTFSYNANIDINTLIPAPVNGLWAGNVHGYVIGANATLKAIWVCINRFKTINETSYMRFVLKYLTADGSFTTPVTVTGGTTLREIELTDFPDSGGSFRYYYAGFLNGLSDNVSAGEMVFCRCGLNDIDTVEGVTLLAFWELQ